jgi:hypothetical protein
LLRPVRNPARVGCSALRCVLLASAALGCLLAAAPAAQAVPAEFTWSPDPPVRQQPATFSAVQDPRITWYRWDLDGNGRYDDAADKDGPTVNRTFQNARTYTIGLVTVDVDGNISERRRQVTVVAGPGDGGGSTQNSPPAAAFVFFPAGPIAGEPVTFVSTSTDPDSPIAAAGLQWDLNGDGVFDDATGPSATTSFPAPGTYTISLQISTNATDVATLALNVGAPGEPGAGVGQRAVPLMSPFPVVRIAGRVSGRGARIRRLTVDAPPGAAVSVACDGRGCPFRRVLKTIPTRLRGGVLPSSRLLRIRRLERRLLRPGVTLMLFVTRADSVGKYTRFKIRRAKSPARRDMCLVPGSGRPLSCPAR